ncbi:MAG: hypothetical protein GWO20_08030 [Candidatus Korarchaeota archaeon]|nr:hypothetical protein [Candidatus Korarchaeota archaeon]
MAVIDPVLVGTNPDDGTGDPLRNAFIKLNSNNTNINTELIAKQIAPNNRVVVNSAADFPTPVSDVITLADDTEYWIGDSNVDIGNDRIVVGARSVIAGAAAGTAKITSTTTGDLLTGTDVEQFAISNIAIDADTATIFNFTDTVQGTSILAMANCRILQSASLGSATDLLSVNWTNSGAFDTDQGFLANGTFNIFSIRQILIQSTSATFKALDMGTSSAPTLEIQDLVAIGPAGGFGISGLADSGNVPAGSVATVSSCEFLGGLTPLENITQDDTQWSFMDNSGITDTLKAALLFFISNSTATTINTQDVYEKVNAVWTEEIAKHFTTDSTGKITYKGERPFTIYIDAVIDVKTAASNNIVQMALYKNGSLEHEGIEAEAGTSAAANLYVVWQLELVKDDFIELFIRNRQSTQDLTAVNATASIR